MAKNRQDKLKEIQSTQMFSPIREISDGIICTKDDRFVKLMEFSPINFSLRSADEQSLIVSQFAMALRTMPDTLQFKIISRKADVTKFLDILEDHYNKEPNPRCQQLQMEQMALIDAVGKSTGINRRFFLSFEYEAPPMFKKKPTFEEISYQIHQTAYNIRNALEACGNECISPDHNDDWVMSVLYSILCREKSENVPFADHEFETLTSYLAKEDTSDRQGYTINMNNLFSPMMIDDKQSPNYIMVQGAPGEDPLYYSFAYIPGDSYPRSCLAGWISMLINIGDGVDVDVFAHRENIETTSRKLSLMLRSKNVKARHADDTSSDYDELISSIDSGYYIKQGLASNEDFYYFGCMLTIVARSLDELQSRYIAIRQHLIKRDMSLRRCSFQMREALTMALPLAKYNPGIFGKLRRNILGSQLASIYPFVSYEMSDENGILLGTQNNGSLVLLDNFDTNKYANANICILGSSGSGKTYLMSCMALRLREKQVQVFIIAPAKGREFLRACNAIGGEYISIAPGSGQNINIMEIRKKDERKTMEIDGVSAPIKSILAAKIQSVETFFSLILPDMSYEEKQVLDDALVNTYASFGITSDNDSLEDPERPGFYKKMPVLKDLHNELEKVGDEGRRLYRVLTRYVTGSSASFSQPTNVNLDNKFVVMDMDDLTDEMKPVGMYIALDYVWDKAREDITARKAIFMDELWKLVGPSGSPEAAKFALNVFKLIRGYGGAGICATQDLNDFFSVANGEFGRGITNNSKIKVVMGTEATEIDKLADALDLTDIESQQVMGMHRGNGLLMANSNHVFVQVQASHTEHLLITTSRQDLEQYAGEIKALTAAINEEDGKKSHEVNIGEEGS